jgi:hypothetical protein
MNKIIIFGLGAIGSNIIARLADEMPDAEFYGIDADYIEKRELPLLPWSDQMYFSWRKVKAVNHWMYIKTKRQVQTTDKYFKQTADIKQLVVNFIDPEDKYIVLECFDNYEARELFKSLEYPILHIGIKPNRVLFCKWREDFDYSNYRFDQGNMMREPDAKTLVDKLAQVAIDIVKDYFSKQADLPQINVDI